MAQLWNQFLALPWMAQFGICVLAAFVFSLLLARQIGVALDFAKAQPSPQRSRQPSWFERPKNLPKLILAITTIGVLSLTAMLLVTRSSAPMQARDQWLGVFTFYSGWFASIIVLIRRKGGS